MHRGISPKVLRYGYANAVGVVMFIIGLIVLGVVNKLFRMDEADY